MILWNFFLQFKKTAIAYEVWSDKFYLKAFKCNSDIWVKLPETGQNF